MEDLPAQVKGTWGVIGGLLGLMDGACGLGSRMKPLPQYRFFSEGWGDLQSVQDGKAVFDKWVVDYHAGLKAHPEVKLSEARSIRGGAALCCKGEFPVAIKDFLPKESHLCEFEMIWPSQTPVWACVISFPGTADQSYVYRRWTLAEPLIDHGVATLLLMPPFYGPRKPASQRLHYITNVADFCHQSGNVLIEGLQLLDWAKQQFPGALLGCTGISWGGAMATNLASLAKRHDMVVIPFLPAYTADVIVTGALRGEVALDRLVTAELDRGEAEKMLMSILGSMNPFACQMITDSLEGYQGRKVVLQTSAFHDTFVPPSSSEENYKALRQLDSGAKLHWVAGGHASSHAAVKWILTGRILKALEIFSRQLPEGSRRPQVSARL